MDPKSAQDASKLQSEGNVNMFIDINDEPIAEAEEQIYRPVDHKDIDYTHVFPHIDIATLPIINLTPDGKVTKKILQEGSGETPKDAVCKVHYIGRLLPDRAVFDAAYTPTTRKYEFVFELGSGQLVPAWELVIPTMRKGEICILQTTPEYGFGQLGCPPRIPGNTPLEYHIELVSFDRKKTHPKFQTVAERVAESNKVRQEGNELYTRGSYRKATRCYNRALSFFNGLPEVELEEAELVHQAQLPLLTNLAACYLKLNDASKAISSAQKALEIDENNVKALWRLGQGYLEDGDYPSAEIYLIKAATKSPNSVEIRKDIEELRKQQQIQKEMDKLRPNPFKGMFNR